MNSQWEEQNWIHHKSAFNHQSDELYHEVVVSNEYTRLHTKTDNYTNFNAHFVQ